MPRDVSLNTFPAIVVEQVPKLRDYKFITAENRLAIVDPRDSKVQLGIEDVAEFAILSLSVKGEGPARNGCAVSSY